MIEKIVLLPRRCQSELKVEYCLHCYQPVCWGAYCQYCGVWIMGREINPSQLEKVTDLTEKCYWCETSVGKEEYCWGCGFYFCDECEHSDPNDRPSGDHRPIDHIK